MGWNEVRPISFDGLFKYETPSAAWRFYFAHSYYFKPLDKSSVSATSEYGFVYASAVRRGNIHGVQFHPEKSHRFGMALLSNFSSMGAV